MPIPDFQTLMLPLLRHLADGKDHTNQETVSALAAELRLTDEERSRLLPSGSQTIFKNRVAWAKAHFKRAGLVEARERGIYRITERGQDVLKQNPSLINLKFLDQFPGHREFRTSSPKAVAPTPIRSESSMTPEEHMALGYQQIRDDLADDLIQRIKGCPPDFFEKLVIDLILAMGYGGSREDAGRAVGRSGDGGIDGIVKEDKLGLDVIYLQAKRWDAAVGRPEVQKFAGALQGQRARRGIFITTSSFTKDARDYVTTIDSKIVLLDGDELAALMIDHQIGVAKVADYVVQRVDSDYFSPE